MKLPSLLLLGCMISAAHGATTVLDLNFNSLPSAQGFTYSAIGSSVGVAESDAFSVDGSSLSQTTVGQVYNSNGLVRGGSIIYQQSYPTLDLTSLANYRMDLRARATALEAASVYSSNAYLGFRHSVSLKGAGFTLGITPTQINFGSGPITPAGFDGTIYHDYRVDVELLATTAIYELFLDGASIYRSAPTVFGLVSNTISFGDGTADANMNGDRSRFIVTTNVPETSSLLLLGAGCLAFLKRRR